MSLLFSDLRTQLTQIGFLLASHSELYVAFPLAGIISI